MNKIFTINKLKIRPNETEGLPNVITHINYTATIIDGVHSASVSQWCTLPHVNTENFIEYSSLTEEQVISWILPNIEEKQLDFMLQRVLLKEKYGTPIEVNPPWIS